MSLRGVAGLGSIGAQGMEIAEGYRPPGRLETESWLDRITKKRSWNRNGLSSKSLMILSARRFDGAVPIRFLANLASGLGSARPEGTIDNSPIPPQRDWVYARM